MTKKVVVIVLAAALLITGITQVAFAEPGERIRDACREFLEDLTPEQKAQVEEAKERYHASGADLREEYHAKREQLRESFLNELPGEAKEHYEEKMREKAERRMAKMENRGKGNGMSFGKNH